MNHEISDKCHCGEPLSSALALFRVNRSVSLHRCRKCEQVVTCPHPYSAIAACPAYFDPQTVHSDARRIEEYLGYARLLLSLLGTSESLRRKRLLDFGCGGGETLFEGAERGMEVAGVEINPHQRAYLQERGFRVVPSLAAVGMETFDVVVLSHVLEHLPDPAALLREMRRIMHKSSKMLVSCPNFDSFLARTLGRYWAGLQVEQHVWHFTPRSLTSLLGRSGFHVERLERHALGKGLRNDGQPRYSNAVFLVDTHGDPALRAAYLGLLCLDRISGGRLGGIIRKYGEQEGGDNLLALASAEGATGAP